MATPTTNILSLNVANAATCITASITFHILSMVAQNENHRAISDDRVSQVQSAEDREDVQTNESEDWLARVFAHFPLHFLAIVLSVL